MSVAPRERVPTASSAFAPRSLFDRALRPFGHVKDGEGPIVALLLACVFVILSSYYLMKTAREGLILSGDTFGLRGEELKSYAGGAMAVLLLAVVPGYDALASRVARLRLINVSYAIVIGCLIAFFAAARAGLTIGLPFFVWIGIVNMFLIAQFWSYANDLYSEEQGKRLFAIIATGGSLGAVLGPQLAKLGSTYALLPMAAALLVVCVALFNLIERVHRRDPQPHDHADEPISGEGGFALVLRDRYLLLIAALVLVAELVKTTGEYVLSATAAQHASHLATEAARREDIKAFYGDFFFWVNLTSFLIQALLVSRLIQKLGVRALFVLPLVALGGYTAIAAVGGVALIRIAKIAENSTEYSVQNTVRQTLFLPTDRAVKYKAKAAIDTFVVRTADSLSGLLVWVGIHALGFGLRGFAFTNVGLTLVWIAIAIGIARRHTRLAGVRQPPPSQVERRTAIAATVISAPAPRR
jgi:AAA family ATP:ADP antiporter